MICQFLQQHPGIRRPLGLGMTAAFVLLALNWELMQIGAWAGMIRDYSSDASLQQAIEETFSGEKPCSKCNTLTQFQTRSGAEQTFSPQNVSPPEVLQPRSFELSAISVSDFHYPGFCDRFLSPTPLRPPLPP
ncbi:MAG: hypothetical protein ACO3N7_10675, partial [Kiritimatiellia bacterium]